MVKCVMGVNIMNWLILTGVTLFVVLGVIGLLKFGLSALFG